MTVAPAAAGSATNTTTPTGQTSPNTTPRTTQQRAAAQHATAPPVGRTHQRGRRPPAQHAQRTPKEWRLALAAHGVGHKYDPSDLFPHPPDDGRTYRTSATPLQ